MASVCMEFSKGLWVIAISYLLLAAVAQMTPEIIKKMIVDNKDGTYTVTFPGNKDEPITISAPTETERGSLQRLQRVRHLGLRY